MMTETEKYYNELIRTEEFYDFTIIMFLVYRFKFPTLSYNETDQCYYAISQDKNLDGTPYIVRLKLVPIDGTENDYRAEFDAGVCNHPFARTNWVLKFSMGYGFYRNGKWTSK